MEPIVIKRETPGQDVTIIFDEKPNRQFNLAIYYKSTRPGFEKWDVQRIGSPRPNLRMA
jgi:hypothetical protein